MAEGKGEYTEGIEAMLNRRTRQYALSIVRAVQALDRGLVVDVLGRQLVRCGTSVGANYRSACRAKSRAGMIAKLAISEEETDESLYWLELLIDAGGMSPEHGAPLTKEGEEILRLMVTSLRTLKLHPSPETKHVREGQTAYGAELFQRTRSLEADKDTEVFPSSPKSKVQSPN